jgi:hypothetical protein
MRPNTTSVEVGSALNDTERGAVFAGGRGLSRERTGGTRARRAVPFRLDEAAPRGRSLFAHLDKARGPQPAELRLWPAAIGLDEFGCSLLAQALAGQSDPIGIVDNSI